MLGLDWKLKTIKQIKSHKKTFIVYILLRILVVFILALQIKNRNYENAFLCILTLILFMIPSIFEMKLKVRMPDTLEIIILLFIFAGAILGEIQNFYHLFSNWDTILHTLNGFLCAAIGFSLIDILNRTKKLHFSLTPLFVAIVSFCFSMTVGVLWEFFEFGSDMIFRSDMQKDVIVSSISSVALNEDGLNVPIRLNDIDKTDVYLKNGSKYVINGYLDIGIIDTMKDLIVNFIGAITFCTLGYFYVKNRGKGKIVPYFIIGLE